MEEINSVMTIRRDFLKVTTAAAVSSPILQVASGDETKPRRIAIIATVWKYLSHAQHIVDRFLVGYPYAGKWQRPAIEVASLYVDQKPAGDQSNARASEFEFKVYPTVAEALRCGGKKLAVDTVVIIGDDGDYPRNSKGQKLSPRHEFFQQAVKVFEQDGRTVPVFNHGQVSPNWRQAKEMVEIAKTLRFPLLVGSSLPVTWRLPPLELPLGCEIEEALMIGFGSSNTMAYRGLEALQCMVERRKGSETGVRAVQMIEDDAVWKEDTEGRWSHELLEAALSRSDVLFGDNAHPKDIANNGELRQLVKHPTAYSIEHGDGLRTNLLMLDGAVGDFTFAARIKGMSDLQSTQFLLSHRPSMSHSACLVHKIVEMIETGDAPYPVERAQVASAILDRCLDSKMSGHRWLETPQLDIRYTAPRESHFCNV